jgi:hypothetical protein
MKLAIEVNLVEVPDPELRVTEKHLQRRLAPVGSVQNSFEDCSLRKSSANDKALLWVGHCANDVIMVGFLIISPTVKCLGTRKQW